MKRFGTVAFLAVALSASSIAGAKANPAPRCDRVCLSDTLGAFLAALAKHDPGALKVAPAARITENGAPSALGKGIWQTAGLANLHLVATDPKSGQIAALAVQTEGNRQSILFVRLSAPLGVITEIETAVVRPGEGQMSRPDTWAQGLSPLSATVPEGERTSRDDVKRAMNAYLDALTSSGTAGFVAPPLWDDAQRIENGIQTTGRSFDGRPPKTLAQQLHDGMMPSGLPAPSLRVTDRRDSLVDEERGLGVTIGLMNLDLPPGMPDMPGLHAVSKQNRKQILIEFFKVRQSKIQTIEALMYDLDDPAYQTTGWTSDHAGASGTVYASAPPAINAFPPLPLLPDVTGIRDYGVVVSDLDQSLHFYRDVLGLRLINGPTPAMTDARWNRVMNTPGAAYRTARLAIPNELFGIELVEFRNDQSKPTTHSHDDPGTSFLNVGFLDLAPVLERLRASHAAVVSAGGLPRSVNPKGLNAVWLRDPDGHLVEIMQGGWEIGQKSLVGIDNALRGHFGITEADAHKALEFYRDALGFDLANGFPPMIQPDQFIPVGPMSGLLGIAPKASMTGIQGHCAHVRCEMFEFRDGHGDAFRPTLQDRGANFLALWVTDIDTLAQKVIAHGGSVVTPSGRAEEVAGPAGGDWVPQGERAPIRTAAVKALLVRDPAGFLLQLIQPLPDAQSPVVGQ